MKRLFKPNIKKLREMSRTMTYKEIAELLGVGAAMVDRYINRKRYKAWYTRHNLKRREYHRKWWHENKEKIKARKKAKSI